MNGRCRSYGGYLVQIDDDNELTYVSSLILATQGDGPFMTGLTDEATEGHFVNYNDKSPGKYFKWAWAQPDNWNNEDCVNISIAMFFKGLNDIGCGINARYICEVPV
ncbi:C-type lectin 2 [Plakobranchus ocellatus]|uniref:C-type lectin 2 n=1 Tax=Plakobranchus ocellatus TaxID=259542 RepID=A0AAV4BZL8_9GAST|nr:C-type lectin 2 [Plakobranchus ocellatus]